MVSAEFDPADEFGDDGSGSGIGGGRGVPAGFGGGGLPAAGLGNAAATQASDIKRYLLIDTNLPFKKRGFYLSLKMDHTKIPLLIAELTANEKSVWPIEVMRVQMSRLNEDDSVGGQRGGRMGMGGMPAGGMPPGGMQPPASGSTAFNQLMAGADGENGLATNPSLNPFGSGGDAGWSVRPGTPEVPGSTHAMAMRSAYENALRDPVMAQVTICGAITMFKEVKEPEKPAPAATTTEDTEMKSPSADDSSTEDPEGMPAETPLGAAGETTESAEPTTEMNASDDSAEKPENAEMQDSEEPKPESGEPK